MMSELHPDDATLLGLAEDEATGVPYIATGQTPYYLAFRRLQHRLLLATKRANDLRVYAAGDLSIGVRAGRCVIAGNVLDVAAQELIAIPPQATTWLYIGQDAAVNATQTGLPPDTTTHLPLAEVVADAIRITSITDLRGQTLWQVPSLQSLGVTTGAAVINQSLSTINAKVTSQALNALCNGSASGADTLHRHSLLQHEIDGTAALAIQNNSFGPAANAALRLQLPWLFLSPSELRVNRSTGHLQQVFDEQVHDLVGAVHQIHVHPGPLTSDISDVLSGVVPISGEVVAVILSLGTNIASSATSDGVAAVVKVNGQLLTTAPAQVTAGAGAGFRCTDQGDGTPAVIDTSGVHQVQRGDLLSVSLARTATGSISQEPTDVAVLVVIRAGRPE